MSLVKYEILLNALKCGSITGAAEYMGYTQSGISHMLNRLEDDLGVKLISRNKKGVQLTPIGESLIPYIKRVVSENEAFLQAVSEITDSLKGKLVIGSFPTISAYYLPDVIKDFIKEYPNIAFEVKNGSYVQNDEWVLSGETDFGFTSLPTEENFKYIPVAYDRIVIITGKEFKPSFYGKDKLLPEDIADNPLILIDSTSSDFDYQRLFRNVPGGVKNTICIGDSHAAITMVVKNMGVGVLPLMLAKEYKDSLNIYEMKVPFTRTLALTYKSDALLSPIAKKFIEFIRNRRPVSFEQF